MYTILYYILYYIYYIYYIHYIYTYFSFIERLPSTFAVSIFLEIIFPIAREQFDSGELQELPRKRILNLALQIGYWSTGTYSCSAILFHQLTARRPVYIPLTQKPN